LITLFENEDWKDFEIAYVTPEKYAVSNYGRIAKYLEYLEDGELQKCRIAKSGYKNYHYRGFDGERVLDKHVIVHELVATTFLPERTLLQTQIIHINGKMTNNHHENLKWATEAEYLAAKATYQPKK
jgi:hypothetical protein